ncbi:ParA family protein [Nocardia bhagyanarayanae]|uniref:Chromosome partitioning protein n=1 Tax=Nocardia bhagyanarayanae TaxID=1215925 RepID=A0A543F4W6_9NOCA|nr:ParA family protein [Nocardia bhagyanarayanae]TQM28866.1 chromosome partitioning protein [Nocardia bhagyanarayanae]
MTNSVAPLELPKPLVITLGNLKGGVGKTTSAFFLACYFARVHELRVLVIDADPLSQTGYSWYRRLLKGRVEVPFELIAFPSRHVDDCIHDNANKYDVVIVDAGGESAEIFKAAIPASDELVLLTSVSPSEVKRVPSTYRAAAEAAAGTDREIRVRVLMTKVPVTMKNGVNVSTEYRTQRGNLEDAGYDVFASYLSAWKWYREAADGEVGDGAENPIADLGEYQQVGDELVAPYRVAVEVSA